jgi:hypothetical protein
MAALNKKQIANMQEEFFKLQKLEIAISGDNTKTKKLLSKYGAVASLYTNPKRLNSLVNELERIIADLAATGRVRGKVMSLKTMAEYLDKSDKTMHTQRVLDAIDRANNKKAAKRIGLYSTELAREKGILQSDIDVFMKRASVAGYTENEILKQLVLASEQGTGPVAQLAKRLENVERDVLRREASAAEIDEYRKVSVPDEKWEWITISAKPCPDCEIRAGVVLTYDEWNDQGLPGDGRTICRSSCMCKLMPVSVADELFPDVKTFEWDKKSGVLTTKGEMRIFGADKNQGANT